MSRNKIPIMVITAGDVSVKIPLTTIITIESFTKQEGYQIGQMPASMMIKKLSGSFEKKE